LDANPRAAIDGSKQAPNVQNGPIVTAPEPASQRPIIFLMFGHIAENARETWNSCDPDVGLRTSPSPAPLPEKLDSSARQPRCAGG